MMSHSNAVPVAHMLDRPSMARIVKVSMYANISCWLLYLAIGIGGYLSFQTGTQGDFLLNYPLDSAAMLCCRVMLSLVCYLGIPLNIASAVQGMKNLWVAAVTGGREQKAKESPLTHGLLASVLLSAACWGALQLTNVASIISLVGGSLTTLQMFWLPAFIYWRLVYPTQPVFFRRLVLASFLLGGTVGFLSLLATAF